MLSISIVTLSPGLSQRGVGFAAMPTPCGVPVRITVPGTSVVLPLRNSMIRGTSKIMSEVVQSCSVTPLMWVAIFRLLGFLISSVVTSTGPSGQKVSKNLPRHHWPPPNRSCQSRADTSLQHV